MDIIDKKLEDLIESINHVSLNQEDLLAACTEFSKLHFKKDKKAEKEFDKFWDSYFFIEQACISSREAIVLGLHSLTLAETIDFSIIMERCINLEAQQKNLQELTKSIAEQEQLRGFFDSLRKELFSRIYSQNKSLQKVTELSPALLSKRYDLFMKKNFK
jgi:hypothetical protein